MMRTNKKEVRDKPHRGFVVYAANVLLASLPSYTNLPLMADKYVWLMEQTHAPCVPTYVQADNQWLTPYVSISAISRGKMAEIAR